MKSNWDENFTNNNSFIFQFSQFQMSVRFFSRDISIWQTRVLCKQWRDERKSSFFVSYATFRRLSVVIYRDTIIQRNIYVTVELLSPTRDCLAKARYTKTRMSINTRYDQLTTDTHVFTNVKKTQVTSNCKHKITCSLNLIIVQHLYLTCCNCTY